MRGLPVPPEVRDWIENTGQELTTIRKLLEVLVWQQAVLLEAMGVDQLAKEKDAFPQEAG